MIRLAQTPVVGLGEGSAVRRDKYVIDAALGDHEDRSSVGELGLAEAYAKVHADVVPVRVGTKKSALWKLRNGFHHFSNISTVLMF